ncbi:hypothetical protein MNBD_GAMMA03-1543, partial [hydrothermal vent metagenome]
NKQMPILVRDLLLGEWANVMTLMYLRHSDESDEYIDKLEFVDTVIEYSQSHIDNKVTSSNIDALSEKYLRGLKLVAFSPMEVIDKQHALINCLNKIHQIDTVEFSDKTEVELIPPDEILKLSEIREQHEIAGYIEEILEPSDDETLEDIADKHSKIITSLQIGSWLEFTRKDNNLVRAKLSWISPITSKYLFVNSRGLKITDKSNLALAAGLRNKTIRVLQQVALFDRALSAIANRLKKDDKPT